MIVDNLQPTSTNGYRLSGLAVRVRTVAPFNQYKASLSALSAVAAQLLAYGYHALCLLSWRLYAGCQVSMSAGASIVH
eukprot:6209058-Pleurochrysis_carterae.AAC.4